MDIHLDLDRRAPLRAQLERELRQAIRSGRLRAGTKLPSSRLLAEELRVSRGVVVEAYSQLVAEGYLATRSGDGTRVVDALALQPAAARAPNGPVQRVRYDLRSGVPDLSFFPRREWQSASAAALRELPDAALGYGSRRGHRRLRVALSDYLGRVDGDHEIEGNECSHIPYEAAVGANTQYFLSFHCFINPTDPLLVWFTKNHSVEIPLD